MNKIVMFVDTGIDDAVAIILSAFDARTKLKCIVACAGNSTIDDVAKKTIQVLQFVKKDIPVFKGYDGNFSKKGLKAQKIHGPDGQLGGFNFPETNKNPKSYEEFVEEFAKIKGKVDILCISPITTIAKMILDHPEFKKKICHIYFQGGLLKNPDYVGFNVGFDPKAVEIIVESGIRLIICPSDCGHKAYLSQKDLEKIKKAGKTGEMLEYIFRCYYDADVPKGAIATHDGCVSFLARHWGFFLMRRVKAFVEYNKDGYGILKFDFKSKPKNASVCTVMFKPKFKRFVFRLIKKAK